MKRLRKLLSRAKKNQKGFTLVELIVVLVIISILAAILVPSLTKWIDKANEKQVVVDARTVYLAAQTVASEQYGMGTPVGDELVMGANAGDEGAGHEATDLADLDPAGYEAVFTIVDNKVASGTYTTDRFIATLSDGKWTVTAR